MNIINNQDSPVNLNQSLEKAILLAQTKLTEFSLAPKSAEQMELIFGRNFDRSVANSLLEDWQNGNFTNLPQIQILRASDLNGANGGFARSNNTIYLSEQFLTANTKNVEVISAVLIEEIGHFIDSQINSVDAPGDEGELFADLVQGEILTESKILEIKSENDRISILDGQIEIEANTQVSVQWQQQLGSSSNDESQDLAVDSNGNIYITGFTAGALQGTNAGSDDAWVAKYNSDGNILWSKQFGTSRSEQATDIVVDGSGNSYLTGFTSGNLGDSSTNAGGRDAWVAKYDTDGNRVWIDQLGSLKDDESQSVALDNAGNVYITGFTEGDLAGDHPGAKDVWLAKYDKDGNLVWTKEFGSANNDLAYGITVDNANNLYLTGFTNGDLGGRETGKYDSWVAKYDLDGNNLWLETLNSDTQSYSRNVAVDSNGNVYLTGIEEEGDNTSFDAFLAKYSPEGSLVWKQQLASSDKWDSSYAVAVDNSGKIYISGYTAGTLAEENAGSFDAWVAQYDSNGTKLWTRQLGTAAEDSSLGVEVDDSSNVYISGYTAGNLAGENAGGNDAWVAKLEQETQLPTVSISDSLTASPGEIITVPISIDDATGIVSADITLKFDADIFEIDLETLEFNLGSLTGTQTADDATDDWNSSIVIFTDGTINFNVYDETPLTGGTGSLIELKIKVLDSAPVDINSPIDLVSVSLNEDKIPTNVIDGGANIVPDVLQVTNLETTSWGFNVSFNNDLELNALNLYAAEEGGGEDTGGLTQVGFIDPTDVFLVGENTGIINGSLFWDESTNTLSFIKTGDILAADNYTLILQSGLILDDGDGDDTDKDGFGLITPVGAALDGNGNSTIEDSDNYTNQFTIESPTEPILSLPDFSRGPGQEVDVPADDNFKGIPINITQAENVQSVKFNFVYNPDILQVNGVNLAADLPADWKLNEEETNFETPGTATISLTGTEALSNVATDLVYLNASVLDSATSGSSEILKLDSIVINGDSSLGIGDVALHQVAFFGDVSGNEEYNSLDASLISRVAVGIESGFDAFPLTDPLIVGDVSNSSTLSGLDASIMARKVVGLLQREIPDLPTVG